MRTRPFLAALAAVVLVSVATTVTVTILNVTALDPPPPEPVARPTGTPPPSPRPVFVDTPGYWSWAKLDRTTSELLGGPQLGTTSSTESMIKVWIVADALRGYTESGIAPPAPVLSTASAAIRDSDDQAAERLYRAGGGDEVVQRLTEICGLTDTTPYPGWWSRTEMSARDAVRMGLCVADGRAAGPEWTEWVLAEMRQVRGSAAEADQPSGGRWGIIDALPADQAARIAIKNGWTAIDADDMWHISCLAITEQWILAVQARYPVELGLAHGAGICRDIAHQLDTGYG